MHDAEAPAGLYLIALHGHTPGGPIAHLAVGLVDSADADVDPEAVVMVVVPASGDAFVDWRDSPWQTESYLGHRLDRDDALVHPRRLDFFEVAGYVAKSIEEVGAYLFPG